MPEVADIFRTYGPQYRQKFGKRMPASHRRAMTDIEQCRTEALGGRVYHCADCDEALYSYHSCQNRHCPKCQNEAAERWLCKQQQLLLPCQYFMVTFTLPAELRPVARRHPKTIYNILFRSSAAALQKLATDPRFVGGQIGMVGVLHTWTRTLDFHPHIHFLVPAGALAADDQRWLSARRDFLVHVKPLSKLFRAKFRDALKGTDLFDRVPGQVWSTKWVTHCKPVGNGTASLKYLAPYIFRVALSNNRLVKIEDDQVTFRYIEARTNQTCYCTLPAEAFIGRFLQHVLPKGFVKVRYYGLFSPSNRARLKQARRLLGAPVCDASAAETDPSPSSAPKEPEMQCPKCGRLMHLQGVIAPSNLPPP